jgi:hypothetical protein
LPDFAQGWAIPQAFDVSPEIQYRPTSPRIEQQTVVLPSTVI